MKMFIRSLFLLIVTISSSLTSQAQSNGSDNLVGQLSAVAHSFVADPARHRIYASLMADNSVAVIDTQTLKITNTIATGSAPAGMSMSSDGLTLYVALSGVNQIGVINLTTLTASNPLTVGMKPWQIEAGPSGRLYITPAVEGNGLLQVDAATGATQATLDTQPHKEALLQISSDRTKLYCASTQVSPATLKRYDVSTATAILEENTDDEFLDVGQSGKDLQLSHNGATLTYATIFGNNNDTYASATELFDSLDFTQPGGNCIVGPNPSFLTFSPDDSILYEHRAGPGQVYLFDTATAARIGILKVLEDSVSDLITDESGQYLFVADATAIEIYDLLADVTTTFYGTTGKLQNFQVPIYIQPTSINTTDLPAGLTFDSTTKVISGTPTADGIFPVTVTASDGTHTVTATLTLIIYPNEQALNISTRSNVTTGAGVLIAGFIITGVDAQNVVLRGIGP
ncbi:MAG TPA: putative Ig domain-containing protein, partial [Candidatus Binatia bacterium]